MTLSGIEIFQLVAICLLLLLSMVVLAKNWVSIIIVLPLLGILIAFAANIHIEEILKGIIGDGVVWGKSYIIAALFGGMFGFIIYKTGITKEIIKKVAELAGTNRTIIAVVMLATVAVVFSGSAGMGGIIATGTIALPLMIGMGIRPVQASIIFLFGMTIGGSFSVVNWTGINAVAFNGAADGLEKVKTISMIAGGITAGVALIYIFVTVTLMGRRYSYWAAPTQQDFTRKSEIPWYSMISVLIPVAMVFIPVFKDSGDAVPVISLSAATLWAIATTKPKRLLKDLPATFIEGSKMVLGPIAIFIGLGIFIKAVFHANTKHLFGPITDIIPTNKWALFGLFAILSPLALYRGPLNRWGLGNAIFGLLTPAIGGTVTTYAIWGTGVVQSVSDPANTANIWTAGYVGTSTTKIMVQSLPWTMAANAGVMTVMALVA